MLFIPLIRNLSWWSLILAIEIVGGTVPAKPVRAQEYSLDNLLSSVDGFTQEMLPQLDNRDSIDLPEGLVLRMEPKVQDSQAVKVSPLPVPVFKPQPVVITPPSIPPASTNLSQWFEHYGQAYRIDPKTLQAIARCESGFNPGANNGPYGGLYQFHAGTWQTNRSAMGLDANPQLRFQPEEAVKTAAFKISRDGTGAWPVCSKQG